MTGRRILAFALLAFALYTWSLTRIPRMAAYQTPPHPIMHGNYYTFHDMSEQWDAGKRPGTLNMTKNGEFNALGNPYLDYAQFAPKGATAYFCDYYDLDVGFLFPVDAARRLFAVVLPDSFLRTLALQVLVDLLAIGAVFGVLWGWGWLPAAAAATMYGQNNPIATQVSLTFYYFWDAIVALVALLAIVALYSTARRRKFTWSAAAIALGLGLLLGFGVWLRSSWVVYSIVLVAILFCARKVRTYTVITAIALIISAAYPIVRASRLVGSPAMTTRQSWSAAFEALGKDPNPYGLENDDQYLFDLAREKHGAVDANCQGTKRDDALKLEYLKIWNTDRAFIVRSIANRMYLGFLNNGGRNEDDVDRRALILAVIGALWLIFRGGSRRWLAISAAFLFGVSTASICLVYFVTGHYNGVSQICLILLGAGAFDLAGYFIPRRLALKPVKRHLLAVFRLTKRRKWPLLAAGAAIGLIMATIQQPAVHAYFNVPLFAVEWMPPGDLAAEQLKAVTAKIRALPDDRRGPLADALKVERGADAAALAAALQTRFKHLAGINVRDNVSRYDFDFDAAAAPKAQQSLWHSEHFVLGFTLQDVKGFDVDDPSTWSGRVLRFHLKLKDPAAIEKMAPVFIEKFERRGMKLRSRDGNAFVFEG